MTLFGEGGGLVVVSAPTPFANRVVELAGEHGVPYALVGSVGTEPRLRISVGGRGLDLEVAALAAAHARTLPEALDAVGPEA